MWSSSIFSVFACIIENEPPFLNCWIHCCLQRTNSLSRNGCLLKMVGSPSNAHNHCLSYYSVSVNNFRSVWSTRKTCDRQWLYLHQCRVQKITTQKLRKACVIWTVCITQPRMGWQRESSEDIDRKGEEVKER